MKKIINIWVLLSLIGCSEKREFPIVIQLDELKSTNFSFTDNQRIESEKNQIYCPTLLFKKKEFENPYFIAWIGNSELMKKKNY